VLLRHDTFRRLCLARELLAEVRDEPLTIKDVSREAGYHPSTSYGSSRHCSGLPHISFGSGRDSIRPNSCCRRGSILSPKSAWRLASPVLEALAFFLRGASAPKPSAYQRRACVMVQVPGISSPILFPGCFSLMACLPPSAFRSRVTGDGQARICHFREA
jgi:hypothetical protein